MSTSDKTKKNAGDMSLEELLGQKSGAPTDDYDQLNDDQKRNEAGSGLINLAAMVEAQNRASRVSHTGPAPVGQAPVARPSMGGMPVQSGFGAPMPETAMAAPAPAKKAPIALIAIIAAIIVGGSVAAAIIITGKKDDRPGNAELAAMEARLNAMMEQAKASGDLAAQKKLQEQIDANRAGEAVNEEEIGMEFSEEEAGAEEDKATPDRRRRRSSRRTASTSTTGSKTETPAPSDTKATDTKSLTEKLDKSLTATKTDTTTSGTGKTSELDTLLTGGGAVKTGGLPEQPTRDQVTSTMADVQNKARATCGKTESGTVMVRVIVGSNGVVRDAVPQGEHATDTLGRCVSTIARRTARFPAFSKPTFTFSYPIKI